MRCMSIISVSGLSPSQSIHWLYLGARGVPAVSSDLLQELRIKQRSGARENGTQFMT